MRLIELYRETSKNEPYHLRRVKVRFLVIAFFLFAAVLFAPLLEIDFLEPVLLLCSVGLASNLVSLLWIMWGKKLGYSIYFATFVDIVLITIALHYLGGIESTFAWIYVIVLVAVASLHGIKVGIYAAMVSSLLYSAMLVAEFMGVVPHVSYNRIDAVHLHYDTSFLLNNLLSTYILFFVTAGVSGSLSQKLIRSKEQLEQDVKERTRELMAANEQLEIIFRFAPDAYYLNDLRGNFVDGNNASEELIGYTREELIGKSFSDLDLLSADQLPKAATVLAENRNGNPTGPDEFVLKRKNGEHVVAEVRTYPVVIRNQTLILGIARDITDRKKAEKELQKSFSLLTATLESTADGILVVDTRGNIQSYNQRFVEVWRIPEHVIKTNGSDEIRVHMLNHLKYPSEAVRRTEELYDHPDMEHFDSLELKDGRVLERHAIPQKIDGQTVGVVISLRDVTERIHAQQALADSEKRHRILAENVKDMIWAMEPETGRLTYVSPSVKSLLGYEIGEAKSLGLDKLLTPSSFKRASRALAGELEPENFAGEGPTWSRTIELEYLRKDGFPFWGEVKVTFVRGEDGKPVELLGVTRDITERRNAEEALRASEEKFRTLFEESKDGIFISTPDGRFLDINPAGVDMFGFSSKDELLNINIADTLYVDPGHRELIKKELAEKGYVKDYELIYKRKDGRKITVLETVTAVRGEGGEIIAYRGIQRDVTEQKHLQEQLLQAQKMESIGTLAGGIAHDFNNLLGGILGYASLMKTKLPEGNQVYRYADTVERSATRAAELTAQLLAFARGGKYETRIIDLNAIVTETLEIISRTFDKSIEIELHLQERLPTIEADAGQMQQILMNLCVNARDAMDGCGKLIIETSVETVTEEYIRTHMNALMGSYVVLSVTDTGIGMDEETRERIFEPFFTTKVEGKGTGLGLSMVYGVVKNHDGYVRVYSEPGEGATFKVYLPVSGKLEANIECASGAIGNGNGMVLVVDDEASIRSLAKDILESYGYHVLLAEDGAQAVEHYAKHRDEIDLVILDMVMPMMGGRETFMKLKALNPEVKALLSTGYSENGKAKEILESGVMGFLQKPYHVKSLLAKVRAVMEGNDPGVN